MLARLHLVNGTLCGHLLVAWAMGLNAVAWQYGSKSGVLGVVFGGCALFVSWLLSAWLYDESVSQADNNAAIFILSALTLASWLCWVLPALFA